MLFPQFARFPGELQNLVWDCAATLSPGIHFLTKFETGQWTVDGNMLLVPDQQSAALGLVHLSQACRASYAAVQRRNKELKNKTILRILPFQLGTTMSLALDLKSDVVCLGSADVGGKDAQAALDWADWWHIVFSSARRFAIRYQRDWNLDLASDVLCFGGCHSMLMRGSADLVTFQDRSWFCPVCLANLLRRFRKLEHFYLIVDDETEAGFRDTPSPAPIGFPKMGSQRKTTSPEMFHSYSRTYYSPEPSSKVEMPLAALSILKDTFLATMQFNPSTLAWAANLNFGLLAWREDD